MCSSDDISVNAGHLNNSSVNITAMQGVGGIAGDDDSSYSELKTPTGLASGHYITPTSNIGLAQSKKLG